MAEDARKALIAKYIPKLVKSMLGDEQSPEVLRKFENMAWTQIRQIHALSTNSIAVQRKFDALVERFRSENMPEFAQTMQQLCTELTSHPIFKNHYELDVQWSIIDFLIYLAHQPIQNVRRNRVHMNQQRLAIQEVLDAAKSKAVDAGEAVTAVKSQSYMDLVALLEEDKLPMPSWDPGSDDSLSDWSEDDDELPDSKNWEPPASNDIAYSPSNIESQKGLQKTQPDELSSQDNQRWCKLPKLPPLTPPALIQPFKKVVVNPEKLFKLVHSHWWRPDIHVNFEEADQSPMANFAVAYTQFLRKNSLNLIDYPMPKTTNEYCLLREIIFMFFKPVSCCYFIVEQQLITVRENVTVFNVTAPGLKGFLEDEILPAMQVMLQLRHLINEHTLMTSESSTTATLECFAVALRDLIKPITKHLLAFERLLLDDAPGLHSLIKFTCHMRSSFKKLLVLGYVAERVMIPTENAAPHIRSLYLLAELYNLMAPESQHQRLATSLLLYCLRPYCGIIDIWWRRASLEDWRQEFVVESIFCADANKHSIRLRKLEELAGKEETVANLQKSPLYLVLHKHALESAETQELLYTLNRVGDMLTACNQQDERTLHNQLIADVGDWLKPFQTDAKLQIRSECSTAKRQPDPVKLQQNKQLMDELSIVRNRELLAIFTRHIIVAETVEPSSAEELPVSINDLLNYFENYNPLNIMLQDVVLSTVRRLLHQRRSYANEYVMRLYREDLQLVANVRFLRNMLLLEADYLLHPYYTQLFGKIESCEHWSNTAWLNIELHDIIGATFAPLAARLHLELISKVRIDSNKVYEAIEAVQLVYDMEPPMQKIISAANMLQYNSIFRHLLKVKWASWKLSNMKLLRRKQRDPYAPLDLLGLALRRLQIVRLWLNFVVNSLHTHLCTFVLQTLGEQFEQQLANCRNIAELRVLHNDYVGMIEKHCLLTAEFADFRFALEQLFHLVYVLDIEWNSFGKYFEEPHALSFASSDGDSSVNLNDSQDGHGSLGDALQDLAINQVAETELTYIRCHATLAKILHTLVYKHDHGFLTALEVALNTSMPC